MICSNPENNPQKAVSYSGSSSALNEIKSPNYHLNVNQGNLHLTCCHANYRDVVAEFFKRCPYFTLVGYNNLLKAVCYESSLQERDQQPNLTHGVPPHGYIKICLLASIYKLQ